MSSKGKSSLALKLEKAKKEKAERDAREAELKVAAATVEVSRP